MESIARIISIVTTRLSPETEVFTQIARAVPSSIILTLMNQTFSLCKTLFSNIFVALIITIIIMF